MSVSRSRSALSPNNSNNVTNSANIHASSGGGSGSGNRSNNHNSNSSSGYVKDKYIYELPLQQLRLLTEHLDELQVWPQLAEVMQLRSADVKYIKQQEELGRSPAALLIQKWGVECKHTVTELFMVLWKKELHQAMRLLKDFVERKYHLLIPRSQPKLSMLMADDNTSHKLLNRATMTTSSGVSNSNNNSSISLSSGSMQRQQHTSQAATTTAMIERDVREFAKFMIEIDYEELSEATQNWSDQLKLGRGGFGTVYKGLWKCTEVAVKQLQYNGANGRDSSKVQLQQSLNELKHLSRYRHDNVVPLFGYSLNGEKPCLVYQLMKGGTLEQRLHLNRDKPLTWQQRVEICLGTARGINFLHVCDYKPLIHGDIKPANVLLDICLNARIGDFGLARVGPDAISNAVTVSQIYGTKPYLPREFLRDKQLSTKVDTYSYGVVIMETFTGLRAFDHSRPRQSQLLADYIKTLPEEKLTDLIDRREPLLPGEREMCQQLIALGCMCIADAPDNRPEMDRVYNFIQRCKIYPD